MSPTERFEMKSETNDGLQDFFIYKMESLVSSAAYSSIHLRLATLFLVYFPLFNTLFV